jgi:two-component system, cell cycle response regulator
MDEKAFPFTPPTETNRPQVLVLMADAILDGLYRNRLQSADLCLVWCDSVKDWKAAVQSFKYDIVVADLGFFKADNTLEPLQQLSNLATDAEIIVLSDDENARPAIAAFQMGVADYFLKPVNPETLLWAIEKAVQKRTLKSSNESFSEDIRLFNVLHQLAVAESETKKRAIAIRKLVEMLGARGALWARPGETICTDCEYFGAPKEEGQAAFLEFLGRNPNWVEKSFESNLTNHPELWIKGASAWIPLQSPWMGGIFLHGIPNEAAPALKARVDFLVRNLEISLESQSRFVKARQLSFIDDLTGLYNSRYLEAAVTAAIDKYQKTRQGFCVLFIDVDRFKSVNDTHGHLVGSRLLVEIAHLLKRLLRKPDHLFRYGGDEFIAILYGAELQEAMRSAERLRTDIEKHRFLIQKAAVSVTLSIGVARFPDHGTEKGQVIQLADEAMYEGKKAGRNSVFLAPQKSGAKIAA